MQLAFFIIFLTIIAAVIYIVYRKKPSLPHPAINQIRKILNDHVLFYQKLSAEEKTRFEESLLNFLRIVRITGVKTRVEDIDGVLVAAAAIIPIFAFKGWEYRNIHEVLLYPASFNEDYLIEGKGRDTLGMVGNGPMQNVMILSQQDLRNGFLIHSDKSNTAIHEFVHLVDKTDGATDGLPDALLPYKFSLPWLARIREEIQQIKSGDSDINPYGATNEAEFLAVAAEYFFEQPLLLQEKHPDLYASLQQIFNPLNENSSR